MPVTIYGKWWPKGWATAEYVDNRILRQYYSSAKIVLSDQNAYMKDFGVIVNRILMQPLAKRWLFLNMLKRWQKYMAIVYRCIKPKKSLLIWLTTIWNTKTSAAKKLSALMKSL